MKCKIGWLVIIAGYCLIRGPDLSAFQFEAWRPGHLSVPKEIKKVFIHPEMIDASNDNLLVKDEAILVLRRRLNELGRFQVIVGAPKGFDPNKETVAIIQGDIISGGETDEGQFTQKAVCRGGLSGLTGAAAAAMTSRQGITLSRRGMPCKEEGVESMLAEGGIKLAMHLMDKKKEAPPIDEAIRTYKYKNVSLFAQINLSLTKVGKERETLAIRANSASFGRHMISPGSFRNVRESGDNAVIIWAWFQATPVAPVIQRRIGVTQASNPASSLSKWLSRRTSSPQDIPSKERKRIISRLINKALSPFIRAISPYKVKIDVELASGGNGKAEKTIRKGRFLEARKMLRGTDKAEDLYNMGLTYEAAAVTREDYEEAMSYYERAFDKDPDNKLFAKGIGRMELNLQAFRKNKYRNRN